MFDKNAFPQAVPARPMGRYAHIVVLRETDSYALFQTDGELNTTRVRAGIGDTPASAETITRLTIFKRKQTTPERLAGRELLRHYGFLSEAQDKAEGNTKNEQEVQCDANGLPVCDYNVRFCMQCPDCISYGFAIGDSGSEKSKVLSDTAYSLTRYETSHETFTLNAPYEAGTMSRGGEVTSRINEQDHVRPQTLFPAIITTRDLTYALFLYVLGNIQRTRRYGAQTTRTGTMTNHIAAIVLADGEITSNLRLTQATYDVLQQQGQMREAQPIDPKDALAAMAQVLPGLVQESAVHTSGLFTGRQLQGMLNELPGHNDQTMRDLLQRANEESRTYYGTYIKKKGK